MTDALMMACQYGLSLPYGCHVDVGKNLLLAILLAICASYFIVIIIICLCCFKPWDFDFAKWAHILLPDLV